LAIRTARYLTGVTVRSVRCFTRWPETGHAPGRRGYVMQLPKAKQKLAEQQTAVDILIGAAEGTS
jgi:hypothetical protein